jgi:hypothetical protein
VPNDSFQVYNYAPAPTSEGFYVTDFTPTPLANSFYFVSATTRETHLLSYSVTAILGVSTEFIAAWEDDTVYAKAQVIIEFGNNRFNDNAVITASSTKTVDRIDPFTNASFWKPDDVFNNKDRQTVNWMVCDRHIKADAGYRVVDLNNTTAEKGWWSANKSNGSGVFTTPEWVQSTFDARYVNRVKLYLMEGYSNMSNVTVEYHHADIGSWFAVASGFTTSPITYEYSWDMGGSVRMDGLRVYINNTLSGNDYARVSELQGLLVLDVSEQVVSCDVESVREEYEGTVPIGTTRSNTFNLELENIDQVLSPDNTDESIFAQYMGQDNRVEIYYGASNTLDLSSYLELSDFVKTNGNANLSIVGNQLRATSTASESSVTVAVGVNTSSVLNTVKAIPLTRNQTLIVTATLQVPTGWNSFISYVAYKGDGTELACNYTETYLSNTIHQVRLDSVDKDVEYIGIFMGSYGSSLGSGNVLLKVSDIHVESVATEYVQMGEFWTDEWQVEGGGVTARTSGRDFSKFLQDDTITIGRVWQNETVGNIFKDIMQLMGFGVSRIDLDDQATRIFSIAYIKDESIWSFMSQIAFADQGLFGFGRDGRFYYHSYNRLNRSPYYNISYDYDQSRNIVDGQFTTAIYTNKVTVNVTPINLENTGTRSIWGAEDPTILSWNVLATSMTNNQTFVNLVHSANDPANIQYYLPDKNGFIYIGSELIKYGVRSGTTLTECVRGHSGTPAATHTAGTYIGEARKWDIEYDNYPALNVQSPYVTAIDGRLNESLSPIATLVLFQQDAFTAKLVIANAVQALTILEGTGPAIDQPDPELPWTTVIAGQVPIEEAGREKIGIDAEDSPENAVAIRKYGKNQIDIDNKWIQDKNHGLELAENIIAEYAVPRKIVEFNTFPYPALDLGIRVYVANYDQLSIRGKEYHLIGLKYNFDGGLQCSATLRETLPSSNHRFIKSYNTDAIINPTPTAPAGLTSITDWQPDRTDYTMTVVGNSLVFSNNPFPGGFAVGMVGLSTPYPTFDTPNMFPVTPSSVVYGSATMTTSIPGVFGLIECIVFDSSFGILGFLVNNVPLTVGVPTFVELPNTPAGAGAAWIAVLMGINGDDTAAGTFLTVADPLLTIT